MAILVKWSHHDHKMRSQECATVDVARAVMSNLRADPSIKQAMAYYDDDSRRFRHLSSIR